MYHTKITLCFWCVSLYYYRCVWLNVCFCVYWMCQCKVSSLVLSWALKLTSSYFMTQSLSRSLWKSILKSTWYSRSQVCEILFFLHTHTPENDWEVFSSRQRSGTSSRIWDKSKINQTDVYHKCKSFGWHRQNMRKLLQSRH